MTLMFECWYLLIAVDSTASAHRQRGSSPRLAKSDNPRRKVSRQDALFHPALTHRGRPSVATGVPEPHGSMKLIKRHRTIYFEADNSNVSEQSSG